MRNGGSPPAHLSLSSLSDPSWWPLVKWLQPPPRAPDCAAAHRQRLCLLSESVAERERQANLAALYQRLRLLSESVAEREQQPILLPFANAFASSARASPRENGRPNLLPNENKRPPESSSCGSIADASLPGLLARPRGDCSMRPHLPACNTSSNAARMRCKWRSSVDRRLPREQRPSPMRLPHGTDRPRQRFGNNGRQPPGGKRWRKRLQNAVDARPPQQTLLPR